MSSFSFLCNLLDYTIVLLMKMFVLKVNLIEDLFGQYNKNCQELKHSQVQVATVDSFQGMEKDIIILSCCITQPGSFCSDAHRLNVALTRAKSHLVVVGSLRILQKTSWVFDKLIEKAQLLRADYIHDQPDSEHDKTRQTAN